MEQSPHVSMHGPSPSVEEHTSSAASIPSQLVEEQAITIPEQPPVEESDGEEKHWIEKNRVAIILVAVFMVCLAITAAFKPPRGYWTENRGTHQAGHPILADQDPSAYQAYVAANAVSVSSSFSIITMLMCGFRFNRKIRVLFFKGLSSLSIMGIACCYIIMLCV